MKTHTEYLQSQIEEFKVENSLFWNALRDIIWQATTLEEAKAIASKAERSACPFAKLIDAEKQEVEKSEEVAA